MPADATPAFLLLRELPPAGEEIRLDPDNAHYVARVCRARAGDSATATDGMGGRAKLRVLESRGEVRIRIESVDRLAEPARATLGCGPPEGERGDWLIEKLAELGVRRFQPLECERGGWERFASRRPRLERLTEAALRQSQRCWGLEIAEPVTIAAWLASLGPVAIRHLADPAGGTPSFTPSASEVVAAIGPSSGFSPSEREEFRRAGFVSVRLSAARLRTETAAMAWGALWSSMGATPDFETGS